MKRAAGVLSAVVVLWGANAAADPPAAPAPAAPPDKAACLDASVQGQTFRDAHKLVEARDQFRTCSQQACPAIVQKDCVTWLGEAEQGLPTVVISAKDGAGHDLLDVKVTVDGQPLTAKLQGDALPLNPGPHALHFEAAPGMLDQQVLVKEGVKNQSISVVLGPVAPAGGVTPPEARGTSPLRTVGLAAGGVGIAGIVVGAIFGVVAISDKSSADCVASFCKAGPLSSANSAATISTITFIAGGVLLAGGAGLYLFGPKEGASPSPATATLRLAPAIGPRDGGLLLGGTW